LQPFGEEPSSLLQFQACGYFFCSSIFDWDFEWGKIFREAPMLSRAKRELVFCFFILLALAGPLQGARGDASLFVAYEGPMPLPSVNPAIVSRQRLVSIQMESLPMDEGQPVVLNLFEDTELRAVCDGVELIVSGGFVWNGHIEGAPGESVTILVAPEAMAGAVEMAHVTYHVRHVQDGVHVIREVEAPVYRSALSSGGVASSEEQEVVRLVNLERAIANLHPLAWDNSLGAAAWDHSTDMAQQNYFSHTSLDGRQFNQRIAAAGYAYSTGGENIACGYSTPQAVMNGWMNSSGHRANILNASFCDIGVGYAYEAASSYGHYWTQDFGRRSGVSVCPASSDPVPESPSVPTDTATTDGGGGGGGGGGGCFIHTIAE
jgi:uncharacterized protein YkwD